MALGLELHLGIFDVFAIDISECGRRADAYILQSFQHVNHIRGVNTARTCSAREEIVGVLAKQGNRFDYIFLPRQCAVILQKNDTFGGCLSGDGSMSLEVGGIAGGILVEARGFDDVLKHAAHVTIDIGDVETTVFYTVDDLLYLSRLTRFHEIIACLYLTGGGQSLADADPVGHHDSFEAPVVTEDLGEQVVVAHRELAVDLVIRGHDGPGVTLADGNLEAAEVELTGGTLTDALVNARAVCLLGVYSEMLGRDACTLTLHTVDIGGGDLTCQQRVFGIIFEVTTAEGVAVQVHARAEDDVAAVFLGLVTDGFAHLAYKLGVPGGSQTTADREGRGIVGLVCALACGVDTYAGRTVCQYGGRDAETGNGWRGSCGTCHKVCLTAYDGSCTKEIVGSSDEQFGFLFKGHSLKHLVDVVGT